MHALKILHRLDVEPTCATASNRLIVYQITAMLDAIAVIAAILERKRFRAVTEAKAQIRVPSRSSRRIPFFK
ncbi:hypothetical protein CKO36_00275 [Rhabdochromatium marinum]|nr:hypothetical protein [Rhabdochromatium marinum]